MVAATFSSCGYVGDPLPPLANVPRQVTDVAAVQRGSRMIVHFTVPTRTTEDVKIKTPLHLELRVNDRQIPEVKPVDGLAEYDIPTGEWTGQTVAISARAVSAAGKAGDWSKPLQVPIVAAPETPADLKAEPSAEGVRLTWTGPPGDFVVLRRAANEKNFAQVAEVQQEEWLDRSAEFGKTYAYLVQRMLKLPGGRSAQSELSSEVSVTPKDTFAPATPSGVLAVAAPKSIELTWDRNGESDLAGYRVYRAVNGGGFEKAADVSQVPTWSDHTVESGKTYRYAVSAFDQAGNESGRSAAVEVVAQ